jgi:hypothetical protein
MWLLSGLVSFSELKNLQNELRSRLEPQTVLLCRKPSVGVEQWILLEPENWSYTPGDSISSNRKARGCYTESAAPRMGVSQARRRGWDITPKRVIK